MPNVGRFWSVVIKTKNELELVRIGNSYKWRMRKYCTNCTMSYISLQGIFVEDVLNLFFLDYATGPGTAPCPLTLLVTYLSPLDDIA